MVWKTVISATPDILRDPYSAHIQALEAVNSPRSQAGLVFHSGVNPTTAQCRITLYTPEKVNERSKPFQPSAPCEFLIRLNPVVIRNRKRVPILERDEIVEWVKKKLKPFKVDAENLLISERFLASFRKPTGDKVFINTVLVRGKCVELPKAFESLLLKGVGREKAFGYGTFHCFE